MNREDFEARVLELWMTTRIPLTRAHLQYGTGVARRKLNGWLDEMVSDSVLECDVDDDGEMVWTVPGAARALDGPRSFAEVEKLDGMRAEARRRVRERRDAARKGDDAAAVGMALVRRAGGGPPARTREEGDGDKQKSLLLSAGLSFFGPLGWLYAGSLREAIPAAALAVLIAAIVPTFLLMPILWLAMPLSAIVGLIYAWQYNRAGQRTPLFLDDKKSGRDAD
ncbi:MAG TPA: hypothetical protein VMZ28_28980 [Kofleriaceae bacterium]|nr:hypothetical protein [Kofleriaceae bacterium]